MDATALPKIQPDSVFSTISKDSELSVGLVGLGRWGRNLLRTFGNTPRVRVRALADSRAGLSTAVAGELQVPEIASESVESLFERCSAVVIATPPASHSELAERALANGCHVFVEKPMALAVDSARHMVEAAKRANRVLMVGHILRYHEGFIHLQARCAAGELGDLVEIHSERISAAGGARPEGPWWSLAPHDADLVRLLFDASAIRVVASGTEEMVRARVEFARGSAWIRVGYHAAERRRRLAVLGTKRSVVLEDLGNTYRVDTYDALPSGRGEGIDEVLRGARPIERTTESLPRDPLATEVAHFVSAILDRSPIQSGAREGYECVRILSAGAESLGRAGQPVSVR